MRLLAATAAALAGLGLAIGAAAPALAAPALAAPAVTGVSISAPTTATAGDTFDVTVTLTGSTDVFGYEAVLAFDPSVVSYVDGSAVVPAGGFDAVRTASGSVDLVYTRLGTSPALSGDIVSTLTFRATAAGSTAFTVRSLSLVDSASAVVTSANAATSPALTITPAAVSSPTPTPTSSAGGSGDAGTSASGTGGSSAVDGDLASTGSNALPYVIGALALLAAGAAAVLFTVRRRRAGDAR
ncbi:hypothetical protein IT072_16490 [Leifsonia sp. ZF2019]|nr:hypothetical protein IT072_16490 [Leifsonia sp. ZF2019]